ncbi:MAG: hypothetical protein K2X87_01075 [Gemmataceae bacterium]|nr:hypothetical protein [Gemmataceae bacterium]
MIYAEYQERAAKYLVRTLLERGGRVPFRQFYDGTDATARSLRDGMELDPDEAEWIGAEVVMDEAAAAMAAQGFVEMVWLDGETLSDGEPAYEIALTEAGRRMFGAGSWPVFRNLDL